MSQFKVTIITISGHWSDVKADTFKKALEIAYLNCTEHWCRYCNINKLYKSTNLYRIIMYVAGYNDRVWMHHKPMNALWWRGEIPTEAKEITGKFHKPVNYSI